MHIRRHYQFWPKTTYRACRQFNAACGGNPVAASTTFSMEIGVFLHLTNAATWVDVPIEVLATA
jgi:hypothetical protein